MRILPIITLALALFLAAPLVTHSQQIHDLQKSLSSASDRASQAKLNKQLGDA